MGCSAKFDDVGRRWTWCNGCKHHPGGDHEMICTHERGHKEWCPKLNYLKANVLDESLHFLIAKPRRGITIP